MSQVVPRKGDTTPRRGSGGLQAPHDAPRRVTRSHRQARAFPTLVTGRCRDVPSRAIVACQVTGTVGTEPDRAGGRIVFGPEWVDPGLRCQRCRCPKLRKRGRVAESSTTAQNSFDAARKVLVPLALAQFICSFAGSNMNVMITDISKDLGTTVRGVQTAITVFLLVMAALMIPGGKLTDRWGRKRCLTLGLTVYGTGALLAAFAPGLGVLILGYSILQGVGTALLIPPVYILATMLFGDLKSRARAFGVISGMGGIGAACGPLIGGLITTAINWRAAFVFQAVIVTVVVLLARRIDDPVAPDPTRSFDTKGAVLSATGLVVLVTGILQADNNLVAMAILMVAGGLVLFWFFHYIRAEEHAGKEPLLSTGLFRNRTSNLGLVTQNVQWLMLMGSAFTVSALLQVERGYNAIQTGVIFTAATLGILVSSLGAGRLAKRFPQRSLILAGFATAISAIVVLVAMINTWDSPWTFAPGLLLIGLGVGVMMTPSVNVVQSSFPDERQGEISGLSRSVSNLGSCLGTAIAGTILVSALTEHSYDFAMLALAIVGIIGLVARGSCLPIRFGTPSTVHCPKQSRYPRPRDPRRRQTHMVQVRATTETIPSHRQVRSPRGFRGLHKVIFMNANDIRSNFVAEQGIAAMSILAAAKVTFPFAIDATGGFHLPELGASVSRARRPVSRVREAMITVPRTHGLGTTLENVRSLFEDDHLHMALVVADGSLITTIERSDLVEPLPGSTPAYQVGTLAGRTIRADRPLDGVTAALKRTGRRRLAVTDGSGGLLGLLCLKHDGSGYCSDEGVRERAAQSRAANVEPAG